MTDSRAMSGGRPQSSRAQDGGSPHDERLRGLAPNLDLAPLTAPSSPRLGSVS
jgi:hypothetical protein